MSALQEALDQFGRRARKLSVARLLEEDGLLQALGTERQLSHPDSRQELAVQIEHELRSAVAAIVDPVDRRVAQAVFASEPEFHDKYVGERRQYVADHDMGFTDDQFKTRRRRVIGDVAEDLAGRIPLAEPDRVNSPNTGEKAQTSEQPDGDDTHGRPTTKKRRWWLVAAAVAIAGVIAIVGTVLLIVPVHEERTWNGLTAAQLEARYDGKDPWGRHGDDSRCADPPPSEVVPGASVPPVMGPNGSQVGTLQLRMSPICPTVVWARVLWNGDEKSTYRIPAGWTLHVVMHRAATNTAIDETEPASASEIPYAISDMISSANGCVYAETYFTASAAPPTGRAATSCARV